MAVIEINHHPSPRELRWFGLLLVVFAGVVGGLLRWPGDAPAAARVVWGAGAAVGAAYAVIPTLRRYVYLGWVYAVFPIGWVVSHALLALIYYAVFTPIGLILRLFGSDPMERMFDRSAATYWTAHRPERDMRRYFRQY